MSLPAKHFYEFGPFRLDPAERLLQSAGEAIPLPPKVFDTLVLLVENAGHLLEKENLMKQLWPDSFVEESNLTQNIFTLRKALGQGEEGPLYIETVPRRGYRFAAEVRRIDDHLSSRPPEAVAATEAGRQSQFLLALVLLASAAVWAGLTWKNSVTLSNNPAPGASPRAVNPQARELYLRGRYFWNKRTEEGHRKAIEHFDQAVAKDPAYAAAYAGLADAYTLLASQEMRAVVRTEAIARARAAAEKALELDESLAEAHTSLAFIHLHFDWNWEAARKHFLRAIEIRPDYPTAHHWFAYYWVAMGRLDEAIAAARRAQQLDPQSVIISRDVCEMYNFAGRYDEAITQCQKTLEMDPAFSPAHFTLAFAYRKKGRQREFLEELEKSGNQVFYLAFSGRKPEAQRLLAEMMRSKDKAPTAATAGILHGNVGKLDEAFRWLERAFEERDGSFIVSRVEFTYEPLRADPRFAEFVRRVGLPPENRKTPATSAH